MHHLTKYFCSLLIVLLAFSAAFAQGDVNIPANEPFGDPDWNFKGIMNGNRLFESFRNHGEIGFWNEERANRDDSDWPAGGEINPYSDGIGIVVGGSVIDNNGNRVHLVSAHYREEVDRSPDLETIWGWHPVPGYLNFDRFPNAVPAMSNDPNSWPPTGWLDQPEYFDAEGNVEWNGRFGRGKFNAQLEAYYIMDDAIDYEFDFTPVAAQPDRGGLGLRVNVRMYQWVHPLAQDVIFAEFGITNLGDLEIDSTAFGWWVDNGIGGTGSDNGLFVVGEDGIRDFDMAVAYDPEGEVGIWGGPAGLAGYAYLESPGIPEDNLDNDLDGLVDERRDNDAGFFVTDSLTGPNGTSIDAELFIDWYGRPPAPHWEGDEDHDWLVYEDANGNGQWDEGENINNDVGTDGVGPTDLNYFGPDPDGTEANGMPDQGEPNFGRTDNDESDQLGMTHFRMIPIPDHPNPQPNRFQPEWFSDDEYWWTERMANDTIFATPATQENLAMIFSSGTFPLDADRTERFSMVIARTLGGENDLFEMIELKETVQAIFNTDYQFSQPPIKPTLTAIAGDGKVTLMWDGVAELSTDPFLGINVRDFSGYRIYRATDPLFQEITDITDENGSAILKNPIEIFDLEDGYRGAHEILVSGAPYDMGNEVGIQHSYTDETVLNGVTYYYAITAFDTGSVTRGLSPTENTTIIEVNNIGEALFSDRNTAVITPKSPAAGYQPAEIIGDLSSVTQGGGSGNMSVEILDPGVINDDDIFRVEFKGELGDRIRAVTTTEYAMFQVDDAGTHLDTLIKWAPFGADTFGTFTTNVFNGMVATITNDSTELDPDRTGWVTDDGGVTNDPNGDLLYSAVLDVETFHLVPHSDIELRFKDEPTYELIRGLGSGRKFLENMEVNMVAVAADSDTVNISIIDVDSSDAFEFDRDIIQIWERTGLVFRSYWLVSMGSASSDGSFDEPGEGDILRIATRGQFNTGDYFEFMTKAAVVDPTAAQDALANQEVAVVPNPYIFTNPIEPADPAGLGQESRLMFIHLPQQATIRIFTLSGKLVDTINVDNPVDDGTAVWDLRSYEDLRIAPGIYIFHVRDESTGNEQLGRFVVIR